MAEQTFLVTHKTRVVIEKDDYDWDNLTPEERDEIIAEAAADEVIQHEPVEIVGID